MFKSIYLVETEYIVKSENLKPVAEKIQLVMNHAHTKKVNLHSESGDVLFSNS